MFGISRGTTQVVVVVQWDRAEALRNGSAVYRIAGNIGGNYIWRIV